MSNLGLTRLQMFCAVMMQCNRDILAKCPLHDRMLVVRHAAHLTLISLGSGVAWTAFAAQFMHVLFAVPCGVFMGCFIFLIDLSIGAADGVLPGIFRRPGAKRNNFQNLGLVVRFLGSLILGIATSEAAIQNIFKQTIAGERQVIVERRNQQTDDKANEKIEIVRRQKLGVELGEVAEKQRIVEQTSPLLERAQTAQADAAARSKVAEGEATKEIHGGGGYQHGEGPHWRDAVNKRAAAQVDLERENTNVKSFVSRIDKAESDLTKAREHLKAAETAIQPDLDRIEVDRVAKQVKDTSDPLINALALQAVLDDPITGPTARSYKLLIMAVLMMIELSYIVVKLLFEPTSVYPLLVLKENKLAGWKSNIDYERELAEMNAANSAAGPAPVNSV